jgi:hypothetical protein
MYHIYGTLSRGFFKYFPKLLAQKFRITGGYTKRSSTRKKIVFGIEKLPEGEKRAALSLWVYTELLSPPPPWPVT